jgi:hypothetical protein
LCHEQKERKCAEMEFGGIPRFRRIRSTLSRPCPAGVNFRSLAIRRCGPCCVGVPLGRTSHPKPTQVAGTHFPGRRRCHGVIQSGEYPAPFDRGESHISPDAVQSWACTSGVIRCGSKLKNPFAGRDIIIRNARRFPHESRPVYRLRYRKSVP